MTEYRLKLDAPSKAQVAFWTSDARVRAYVGGVGSGKTFAGAIELLRRPAGSRIMVAAPTYPMMRDASYATFREICPPALIASHNKSEWVTTLTTGTEILWRSTDNPDRLRGPNLTDAWIDEAAYCTEDAWKVILGRLRRGEGRAWATTTPNGMNWLYKWFVEKRLGEYAVFYGSTADNVHLPATYVQGLREQYADDPDYAAQELEGRFVDLSGSKRLPAGLLSACTRVRAPLVCAIPGSLKEGARRLAVPSSMLRLYVQPRSGDSYVIGCDPAEGVKGGDDSAAVVVDRGSGEVCAILAGEMDLELFPAAVALLSQHYGRAPVMCERNNHGHAVIASLRRHGVACLKGGDKRPGWNTSAASKAQLYDTAHNTLIHARDGDPIIPDQQLRDQLGAIDRATLSHPRKKKDVKLDDEATAWALAQAGRLQSTTAQARSPRAMQRMLGRRA